MTPTRSTNDLRPSSKTLCLTTRDRQSVTAFEPSAQSRAPSVLTSWIKVAFMHRCSESIAKLAAALAKAQGELINPEKSLTATIKTDGGDTQQTFRYAPLSSGLEIVRKTLGRHEIAVVQTTSTDPAAGMINLTTMLAHASGDRLRVAGLRHHRDVSAVSPRGGTH